MAVVEKDSNSLIQTTVHQNVNGRILEKLFSPLEGKPSLKVVSISTELLALGWIVGKIMGYPEVWPYIFGAVFLNLPIQYARAGRVPEADIQNKIRWKF